MIVYHRPNRLRFCLSVGVLYGVICFTSFLSGMVGLSHHPLGYMYGIWSWLYQVSANVSEPITHNVVRTLLYLSVPVFLVSYCIVALVFLAIICLLFVPYLIVLLGVKIAAISLVGALIVLLVAGIGLAALLQKHWPTIVVALAWVIELFAELWKWIMPAQQTRYKSQSAAAVITEIGETVMPRRFKNGLDGRIEHVTGPNDHFTPPTPDTVLGAFRHDIRSKATSKAYNSETEMVNSAINLGRAHLNGHDLQTDWMNRDKQREEKTTRQDIRLSEAKAQLNKLEATQAEDAKLPINKIDRLFQAEYKPSVRNEQLAQLHKAKSRAEARIKAARIKFELEAEIDKGPGTPQQKADLKREVGRELAECFTEDKPKEKHASASPYADEHES